MFKVVVGHSNDPDSIEAIAEVLKQCLDSLEGEIPQAGILFAAIDFEHSLILKQIYQQFPQLELVGGTTDGEISSRLNFQEDSLTLMLFCSDEIEIYAGIGEAVSNFPTAAVQQALTQAKAKNTATEISLCLAFPDGLANSSVAIVDALKQELGTDIPLFGGQTGDQLQFQKTYQFYGQKVYSDAIAVLIFSGKLLFSYGIGNGWNPISKKRKVTKVQNNIVYEVDGKPALDFYQYYLNDSFPSLEYPLAVFEDNSDQFYMRIPKFYDSQSGSITFFAEIPEGATIQIAETNPDRIINSSEISLTRALAHYPGKQPAAALFFSCSTRRKILGTKAEQEYTVIANRLNSNLPSCGFYTYGEIAPLEDYPVTFFHNETSITLLLGTR